MGISNSKISLENWKFQYETEIGWKLKRNLQSKKWEVEKIIVFEILETQCHLLKLRKKWSKSNELCLQKKDKKWYCPSFNFEMETKVQNLHWSESFDRNIRPNRTIEMIWLWKWQLIEKIVYTMQLKRFRTHGRISKKKTRSQNNSKFHWFHKNLTVQCPLSLSKYQHD